VWCADLASSHRGAQASWRRAPLRVRTEPKLGAARRRESGGTSCRPRCTGTTARVESQMSPFKPHALALRRAPTPTTACRTRRSPARRSVYPSIPPHTLLPPPTHTLSPPDDEKKQHVQSGSGGTKCKISFSVLYYRPRGLVSIYSACEIEKATQSRVYEQLRYKAMQPRPG